jgi:hypothetical protein
MAVRGSRPKGRTRTTRASVAKFARKHAELAVTVARLIAKVIRAISFLNGNGPA